MCHVSSARSGPRCNIHTVTKLLEFFVLVFNGAGSFVAAWDNILLVRRWSSATDRAGDGR